MTVLSTLSVASARGFGFTSLKLGSVPGSVQSNYFIATIKNTGYFYPAGTAAVGLDSSDNIYILGGGNSGAQAQLWKIDPSGNLIFSKQFAINGVAPAMESIAVTSTGIYCVGRYDTAYECLIVKLTTDGNAVWAKTFNGPISGFDVLSGITANADGTRLYIAGFVEVTGGTGRQSVVAALDSDANILWIRYYGTAQTQAKNLVLADNSSVYVVHDNGSQRGLVRYDSANGTLLSEISISGFTSFGPGIATDSSSSVYMSSSYTGTTSPLVKWSSALSTSPSWIIGTTFVGNATGNALGGPETIKIDNAKSNVHCFHGADNAGNTLYTVHKTTNGQRQFARLIRLPSFSAPGDIGSRTSSLDSSGSSAIVAFRVASTPATICIMKIPTDGTKTGTYNVGDLTIAYSNADSTYGNTSYSPVTASGSAFTNSAPSITFTNRTASVSTLSVVNTTISVI